MSERDFARSVRPRTEEEVEQERQGPRTNKLSRWGMRLYSEGPRALSTRTGVWVKYAFYWLALGVVCLLVNMFLSASNTTTFGGPLLWFSICLMTVIAAVSTVLQPLNRDEVREQWRHYTFGLCAAPALGIAALLWALKDVITSSASQTDTMASLLNFAIPAIFVCTVVIPPIIFIKLIAGYHTMNRAKKSDSEYRAWALRRDDLHH